MTVAPHLILTVDYELFGDGSGRPGACVLEPAYRMMRLAECVDASLTFFVEALEFIALSEQERDHRARDQLRAALQGGHDVQLHLHPQWSKAESDAQGAWRLDMKRWRIGDLLEEDVRQLLRKGRFWLENEIAAHVAGYRCLAFRAGGWCIQPSEKVIAALLAEGFELDSTVAPGQWRAGRGEWSDFRAAPSLPSWRVTGDVCQPSGSGLWEVPIAVGNIGWRRHLAVLLHGKKQKNAGLAPGCIGSYRGPEQSRVEHIRARMVRLRQLGEVMLDFSTMPADVLIDVSRQWLSRFSTIDEPLPLVAIAHTKNFSASSERNLKIFLAWAKSSGLQFSTYEQWLETTHG